MADKNKENVEAIEIMVNNIIAAISKKAVNCDKTYGSVIKNITTKGYVVLDTSGQERIVKCAIPNVSLKIGQKVWIKEPMGDLNKLHICGVQ